MTPKTKRSLLVDPVLKRMRKFIPDDVTLEEGGIFVHDIENNTYVLFSWESIPQKYVSLLNPALRKREGLKVAEVPGNGGTHIWGLIVEPAYNLVFGFTDEGIPLFTRGSHERE